MKISLNFPLNGTSIVIDPSDETVEVEDDGNGGTSVLSFDEIRAISRHIEAEAGY